MRGRKALCVSFDPTVSDIRSAALRRAGFAVTGTTDVDKALDLLSRERFDLVIVGHRFSKADKFVLTVEAEEKVNTPVLLVCGVSADRDIPASGRVYALEGTAGLLTAAASLLSGRVEVARPVAA